MTDYIAITEKDDKYNDELGDLSTSINIMSSNLKNTIDQLNKEIDQVKNLESLRKDFINQFTHEMKTPLGIINGYSELLEETETEEERQKYLDIINKETVRINDLVQGMLSLGNYDKKNSYICRRRQSFNKRKNIRKTDLSCRRDVC